MKNLGDRSAHCECWYCNHQFPWIWSTVQEHFSDTYCDASIVLYQENNDKKKNELINL